MEKSSRDMHDAVERLSALLDSSNDSVSLDDIPR